MKKVVRVDRRNRVVMVEPGVTFGELIPEMAKKGLAPFLPLSPKPTKSVVASLLEREPITMPRYHWESQDPLRCLEVVYGTGDLFRTGSAVGPGTLEEQWAVGKAQSRPFGPSWFDFAKFVQGGQGSMGIVTWTTVACRPLPSIRKTFLLPSDKLETLIEFTRKMLWKKLGQDLLIVNRHNLACLVGTDQESIQILRDRLPQWIALVSIEGFGLLPEDRVDYQTAEFMELAQSYGLVPATKLAKIRGEQISDILSHPSEEPYWKLRYKGGCQDIFFLTTMDRTPEFINGINSLAVTHNVPTADIGVYLQPTLQGVSCHCEFNLSYAPKDTVETDKVKAFDAEAPRIITSMRGFFSRPYGAWTDVAWGNSSETVMAQRKIKAIFDPNDIMNPGKLCF
jgi:FAD/FMN-containing dehydrogenase